jgi:hypothetical protein
MQAKLAALQSKVAEIEAQIQEIKPKLKYVWTWRLYLSDMFGQILLLHLSQRIFTTCFIPLCYFPMKNHARISAPISSLPQCLSRLPSLSIPPPLQSPHHPNPLLPTTPAPLHHITPIDPPTQHPQSKPTSALSTATMRSATSDRAY